MSFCQLKFPGVRSSLESGFGLKPPASSYRLIFTVVSKLLLLYSTIDKTSTLKMKNFSFRRHGLLFWVPDVLCRHSEVVLWNLLGV